MGVTHTFGQYVRDLRRSAGLSQRALAERLGVSFPYLSYVEQGQRPPIVPSRWSALIAIGGDPERLRALTMVWQSERLNARILAADSLTRPDNSDTLTS